MFWRDSLPARVALATAGLLALVLLAVSAAAYSITARMLYRGVDTALRTTVSGISVEQQRHAYHEREEEHEAGEDEDEPPIEEEPRPVQVIDPRGIVRFGDEILPVDQSTLEKALDDGEALVSMMEVHGEWVPRRGPRWWQTLTPRDGELRVIYRRSDEFRRPFVVQMAAPMESARKLLKSLSRGLLLVTLLGTLLSGILAWRMTAETYRPLRAITRTAEDISARTLSLRIPENWQDRTLRRLIQVLNAMIGRLQEAFDAQGRFTAAAAHELRGPLAAMRAELEVTLLRERSPEEYRVALEGALEETERLTTLAEHLLMLARYERGASLTMERDLPLLPLMQRAATEAQRSAGGEVTVEAAENLRIDGDPVALERMLSNLARNGVQAGGAPVHMSARMDGDTLVFEVRDHGVGIPPEAIPHLFEPFYRGDPARGRTSGGTGLGLAIVKTVVDAHGGRISVESRLGEGSVFRIWLPRWHR